MRSCVIQLVVKHIHNHWRSHRGGSTEGLSPLKIYSVTQNRVKMHQNASFSHTQKSKHFLWREQIPSPVVRRHLSSHVTRKCALYIQILATSLSTTNRSKCSIGLAAASRCIWWSDWQTIRSLNVVPTPSHSMYHPTPLRALRHDLICARHSRWAFSGGASDSVLDVIGIKPLIYVYDTRIYWCQPHIHLFARSDTCEGHRFNDYTDETRFSYFAKLFWKFCCCFILACSTHANNRPCSSVK